jgi:hypothetical protein
MCREKVLYGGVWMPREQVEARRAYQRQYWDAKGNPKRLAVEREAVVRQLEELEREIHQLQEAV